MTFERQKEDKDFFVCFPVILLHFGFVFFSSVKYVIINKNEDKTLHLQNKPTKKANKTKTKTKTKTNKQKTPDKY